MVLDLLGMSVKGMLPSQHANCQCADFAQRSPPLRRGSKVTNPRTRADASHDRLSARSADPGMVVAFDKARMHFPEPYNLL